MLYAQCERRFRAAQIATRSVCKEQVLNQRVVSTERRVDRLQCACHIWIKRVINYHVKDWSLDAERQRIQSAWALIL